MLWLVFQISGQVLKEVGVGGSWPLPNPTTCLAQWVKILPSSNADTLWRCCGLDSRPHSKAIITIKHVT